MPASDLPLNLRTLLDSIVDNNMLRSWQVYSEKDGLTVKLRFNSMGEAPQGENENGTNIAYVKKSPSQQRRDTNRAQNKRTMITRSQKSQVNTSVERPREDIYVSPVIPIESPMSVASSGHLDPNIPVFMPQSTPEPGQCDSQVALNQVGYGSPSTDNNTDTCKDYHSKVTLSADTTITADSESESDDEELEKSLACCDHRCSYGPCHSKLHVEDASFTDDLIVCTYPDCGGIICSKCKMKGAHKSHSRWFQVMTHKEYVNL